MFLVGGAEQHTARQSLCVKKKENKFSERKRENFNRLYLYVYMHSFLYTHIIGSFVEKEEVWKDEVSLIVGFVGMG